MSRHRSFSSFLLLAALATTASAGSFRIDSRGASPRKFRITALCKGIDTWFSPDVYKSSMFDREGDYIKEHPHLDFSLGQQGDRLVLLEETGWQSGEYKIIGDATDLDDIRLLDGVSVEGRQVWDTGSRAWRASTNTDELSDLEDFTGELLDRAWARDHLLGALKAGAPMKTSNAKVLVSALTHYWWDLIDANDDNHDVPFFLAKAREFYLDPMAQAADGADSAARARMAKLNEETLQAASEVRDYYAEDDWRDPVYVGALDAVITALGELQRQLEGGSAD